jgi:hypothetical protein
MLMPSTASAVAPTPQGFDASAQQKYDAFSFSEILSVKMVCSDKLRGSTCYFERHSARSTSFTSNTSGTNKQLGRMQNCCLETFDQVANRSAEYLLTATKLSTDFNINPTLLPGFNAVNDERQARTTKPSQKARRPRRVLWYAWRGSSPIW